MKKLDKYILDESDLFKLFWWDDDYVIFYGITGDFINTLEYTPYGDINEESWSNDQWDRYLKIPEVKVKATDLAKFMYPDVEVKDGFLTMLPQKEQIIYNKLMDYYKKEIL